MPPLPHAAESELYGPSSKGQLDNAPIITTFTQPSFGEIYTFLSNVISSCGLAHPQAVLAKIRNGEQP